MDMKKLAPWNWFKKNRKRTGSISAPASKMEFFMW
jgi:hypothetical protein